MNEIAFYFLVIKNWILKIMNEIPLNEMPIPFLG